MKYKLNHTYTHEFTNVAFDNLDEISLLKAFGDGRTISRFLELWIINNFDNLIDNETRDFDLWDFKTKRKVEVKCYSNSIGCRFFPNYMIGGSRTLDEEKAQEYVTDKIFCIVDIRNYPKMQFKFIEGDDLVELYPKFVIPKNENKFFNGIKRVNI